MVVTFYRFLFTSWISENLQILAKSLETLHKWPKQSSLMKKTYFELPRIHLSGFADSPRFYLYSFQGYLFGIFLHLGNQHITSNWFEILHTSPNHCLLSIKQSLSKLWCTAERFLELTCGCSILLPLSFLPEFLKVFKFSPNHLKVCTNERCSLPW